MSLHKLTAGDGYTYLTRQVATVDSTERGYSSLGDYYAAKGESPGVWIGGQAAEMGLAGTAVTEQQMKNLFGEGLHPDAQRLEAEALAALPATGDKREHRRTVDRAGKLGAKFPVFQASPAWHENLAAAYQKYNLDAGLANGDRVPDEAKQSIRTAVGTAMFGKEFGRKPRHDHELAGYIARQSRPSSTAVAGYDLTFSPVKSVSTLWAIAPPEIATKIEAAHQAAVQRTLRWLETEAGYTREGTAGVSQIRIKGFLATAFTHRDSRAGDPDLHTHVAVSNKVQTPDGRWLALDARMLYRYNVPASEQYNLLLEAEISQRLGGRFAERGDAGEGKREIRELVGVPAALNEYFSSRAVMIDARRAELIAQFQADHGRVPTTIERIQLSQTATLATRQAKHEPMSLGEQRLLWQSYPDDLCGDNPADIVAEVLGHTGDYADITPDLIAELSSKVVQVVSEDRAQWRENNLSAEARRQAKAAGVDPASTAQLATVLTEAATGIDLSIPIGMDTEIDQPIPAALLDVDGKAVFRMAKGQLYTSPAILDAESRIVAAAGQADAWRLSDTDVEISMLEWSANNQGRSLNAGQAAMVAQVATSGRRLQLLFGPAGTGKTTSLAVLTRAAQSRGITVLGLAPQASAAKELGAAIPGITSDTLHKLTHTLTQVEPGSREPWIAGIDANTLVIIDEAGLAGTRELDIAVSHVTRLGGRVLLVGDDRQRAANGAGGVLRDIESTHGALMLDEVMRFQDRGIPGAGALQGSATLAVRTGDPAAVGYYTDRGLIRAATPDTITGQVYAGWAADVAAGADSVMIAPTLDMVSELNTRARADRIARITAAGGTAGPERDLQRGEKVSAGDLIVTKKNKRTLSLGGTDFVRNNYRWTVDKINRDGSITATELTRGVTRTLPAWYVDKGWVRLGYAHTEASVQGMTVGGPQKVGTAHTVFTDRTNRNELYTSGSRATDRTTFYGVVPGSGDTHEVTTPDAVSPQTVVEMFATVLGRDGSDRSATTTLRESADPVFQLGAPGNAANAYAHAVVTGCIDLAGEQQIRRLTEMAEVIVPGVTTAPAWETLRGHLATIAADGGDPAMRLTRAVGPGTREIGTAHDIAAVVDYRLDKTGNHSLGEGPLPWLPKIPGRLAAQPKWDRYLPARQKLVTDLAQQIRDRTFDWTIDDAPAWAVPYLSGRDLVADLAVWRAAHSVPDTDLRPAGPTPTRLTLRTWHRKFVDQAVKVAGDPQHGADRWARHLTDQHHLAAVTADDYFPVLAARLSLADTAGIDVPALLRQAVDGRDPLPVEAPAKALWWRLEPHLGSLTAHQALPATGHRLRPAWTAQLEETVGEIDATRIMSDPLWPTIVAHIDRAVRDGHTATLIVPDAAATLTVNRPTVPDYEKATVLLWQIATLTEPPPPDPDLDDAYPDPAQDDLLIPAGAHQLLDATYAAKESAGVVPAGRRRSSRIEPVPDAPEPTTDPFDADKYAAAAALIDAAYADLDLTDLVEPTDEETDVAADMREPQDEPPADLYDAAPPPPRQWVAPQPPAEPANVVDPDTAPPPDELPDPQRQALHDRLYAANAAALQYYRDQAPTSWVPDYITGRGLNPEPFGYAPNKYTALSDHLRQAGYTDTELIAAGLAKHSARGQIIDRFRDRAVLPITTADGQVAAFIGRINPDHVDRGDYTTAKYLNGPTTDIFTKGDLPYGLNPATVEAIRAGADIVLVEGPMDAQAINTAATTAGRNLVAIAPNGTALTAEHLAALNRIVPLADRTVIEAFDSDAAGRAAADKAHTLLAQMHIHNAVTVTGLTGKDPAQMLTDTSAADLLAAVDQRRPLTDATLDRIIDQYDTADGTVESRYHAMSAAVPVIAALPREQIIDQTIRVAAAVPWDTDRAIDWVARHIPEQPAPANPPAPNPTTAAADDLGLPPLPVLSTDRTPLAPPETAGSLLTRTRTTTDIEDTAFDTPAQPAALDTDPRWNEVTDLDTAAGAEPVDVHLDAAGPPKHQIQQDEDDPQTREATVVAALETVGPEAAELAQQPSRDVEEVAAAAADAAPLDAPEPGPFDDLPDEVLEEEARQLAATHAAVTEVVDNAVDYLQHLEVEVAADDGPEMTRVQTRHTENERRLAAMKEALDASNATDAAKDQTTKLGIQVMEIEDDLRDVRGAFAGRRRTELQQRLDQTKTAYEQQRTQMMEQARRSHELTAKLGTVAQQRDALALQNADTYRERLAADVEQARQQDLQSVQAAKDWAIKSQHRLANTTQQLAEVNTEQTRRAEHPDPEAELRRQELHQQIQDEEAQAAGWGHTSTFDHDLDIPAAPDRSIDR